MGWGGLGGGGGRVGAFCVQEMRLVLITLPFSFPYVIRHGFTRGADLDDTHTALQSIVDMADITHGYGRYHTWI